MHASKSHGGRQQTLPTGWSCLWQCTHAYRVVRRSNRVTLLSINKMNSLPMIGIFMGGAMIFCNNSRFWINVRMENNNKVVVRAFKVFDGVCWLWVEGKYSGVARAFPGGRVDHPEGQNEEEISKVWGKIRKIDQTLRGKWGKWNICLPGTLRLATALGA